MDIVVLDGEPAVTERIVTVLSPTYRVRAAHTLQEACSAVCDHPPDCVLCGYRIGNRTSRSFLSALADAFPDTRRVLMSGSPFEQIQPLLDEGLVHAIVTKPFSLDRLLSVCEPPRGGSE